MKASYRDDRVFCQRSRYTGRMIHLRAARAQDREEIPLHHEGLVLKTRVAVTSWILALAAAGGGIGVMILKAGAGTEVVGAIVAALGGVSLVALVRCRRHESTISPKWLQIGAGPLSQKVPLELIETIRSQPASSWRRVFADRELVLRLSVGREVVFPCRETEELIAAVHGESSGTTRSRG